MSWAANNPEAYQEAEVNGIYTAFVEGMKMFYGVSSEDVVDEAVIEMLLSVTKFKKVADELRSACAQEISEAVATKRSGGIL